MSSPVVNRDFVYLDRMGNSLLSDCLQVENVAVMKKDEINDIKRRLKSRITQERAKVQSGVHPSSATKVKVYVYCIHYTNNK